MKRSTDPWPASGRSYFNLSKALAAAHTPNSVAVGCSSEHPGSAGFTEAGTYGHTDSEHLKFNCDYLNGRLSDGRDKWDESVVAGVLWHEVAHTHGYRHSQSDLGINCGYPADAWSVHSYSVPGINGECVSAVAARYTVAAIADNTHWRSFGPGRYGATVDNLTPVGNDATQYFTLAPGIRVVYCNDQSTWDLVPYGFGTCAEASHWMDIDPRRYEMRFAWLPPELERSVSYVEVRPQVIAFNQDYYGGAAHAFDVGTYSGESLDRFASEQIRSLYIPAGVEATICRSNTGCYSGYRVPISLVSLANITSITVQPRVVLYSDRDYLGDSSSFGVGRYEARLGQLSSVGDNRALSLIVPPDLRVTVCDKEPALGPSACKEFVSSSENLGNFGNSISYVHVRSVWEPSCGDGVCSEGESCGSCPSECYCPSCGDWRCDGGETCSSCSRDCGGCPTCGNGVCGPGENVANCAADCEPREPCFVAGTPITMADGRAVPIESVREGDLVMSYDERLELNVPGRVVHTFVHPDTQGLVELNGITTTLAHRFFSAGHWVPAAQLLPGAPLHDLAGGTPMVSGLSSLSRRATTYNFEVQRTHTYFAGGFLVHNIKDREPPP